MAMTALRGMMPIVGGNREILTVIYVHLTGVGAAMEEVEAMAVMEVR